MSLPLNAAGLIWLQGRREEIQKAIDSCEKARKEHLNDALCAGESGDVALVLSLQREAEALSDRKIGLEFALSVLQD